MSQEQRTPATGNAISLPSYRVRTALHRDAEEFFANTSRVHLLVLDLDEISPNGKLPTFLEEYVCRFDKSNEAPTEIERILEQYREGDSGRESSAKTHNTLLENLGYNNAIILAMSDSSPFLEEAILEFVAQQKYISNSGLHTHQIPKVQFGKYLTK